LAEVDALLERLALHNTGGKTTSESVTEHS
jgi:hypothetical protein